MSLFTGYMLGRMSGGSSVPGGAAIGFFGLFALAFFLIAFAWMGLSLLMPFAGAWKLTANIITLNFYNPVDSIVGWGTHIALITIGVYTVVTAFTLCLMCRVKHFLWAGAFLAFMNFLVLYDMQIKDGAVAVAPITLPKNVPPYVESLVDMGPLACALILLDVLLLRLIARRLLPEAKRIATVNRLLTPYRVILRSRIFASIALIVSSLAAFGFWQSIQMRHQWVETRMEVAKLTYEEAFRQVFYGSLYETLMMSLIAWSVAALLMLIYARWAFKNHSSRIKA